ncbi:Hypothetical protein I5071_55170 [Sandaracinus amylolyticus]|nr:Hypothetical protein I5071_55170 [Sandaracinus amylolyticus]
MQRSVLSTLTLQIEGVANVELAQLERDFSSVKVSVVRVPATRGASLDEPDVDHDAWVSPRFDFWAFDRHVDAAVDAGRPLVIRAPARHAARFASEVLTRAQRRIERRNAASATARFDRVLDAHAALHDLSRPLVRADLDHARDAWQWALRLDPGAGEACQIAALFHDVERLESEADARIEQHAPDYRAYKEAHARAGAPRAAAIVLAAGGSEALAREVAQLVESSETPGASREVQLINDADALSFFSLNSPGFVDYFGTTHARKKVAYTIARMSARALAELPKVRLRPDVAQLVAEVIDAPFRAVEATG